MRRVQIIGALCLAVATCLVGAVGASAAPSDPWVHKSTFDLSGLPGGLENPSAIAVNYATGNVLLLEAKRNRIDQFDSNGNPVNFSGTGEPTLELSEGQAQTVAVDNSGGPSQGTIYVAEVEEGSSFGGQHLWTFGSDGLAVGTNPHPFPERVHGAALAPDGTFWIFGGKPEALAVDALGQLTGAKKPNNDVINSEGYFPYPSVFDTLGNFYARGFLGHPHKYASSDFADQGDMGFPVIDQGGGTLVVDPSTNDLFTRMGSRIVGVHYSDPLVKSVPFEPLTGLQGSGGFAYDGTGQTLYVAEGGRISIFHKEPPSPPTNLRPLEVTRVGTDQVRLGGGEIANGAPTSFHFEYGTDTSYGMSSAETALPMSFFSVDFNGFAAGLQPNTAYHARVVLTNSGGKTYGPDVTFKTYAAPTGGGTDPCPNALARKQTTAQRLLDCRAYELASASDTGGYDVESYLAPGQNPFGGFPLVTDKLLYATHSGAVPGPWNATNKGPDPYVSTRTASGWTTQYEGLPSDLNPAAGSFSSVLGEADSSLGTLAFAGANLCSPCFDSGLQTGIPVRMPSGQVVQGMSGSLAGSVPATAKPEGKVAKYFSQDGKKLLFASKYVFEPGANANPEPTEAEPEPPVSLTVYERDLGTGTTEIVSTDPLGKALTGEGISELDVSSNGSRVLIGKKLGTDPLGNELIHPYLHIAGRPGSIDLAPLTSAGVLYAGMTSDGSKVFFTSTDKLIGSDTDNSADLYEADVDASGNLSLKAITSNNSDACAPVDCSAVPISGGGGVATATGAIYFLSPEQFGGQGTPDQPNLYLASPSGAISLVATLESDNPLLLDSLNANATRKTGDFQTTPSGNYAAFTSNLTLSGVFNHGFRNVFRYAAGSGQLDCASCNTTDTDELSALGAGELAPNGLSLLEDGRVFFTTPARLVLLDGNGQKDVYEWSNGSQQLISSGAGPFDSGLLSASADGADVFFFTHDRLAPEEDHAGNLMKIYDAREGGGFFKLPASVPCQASDECHGASTPQPGPADIKSSGKTTQGNVLVCAKNRVKKRGHCVKKKTHAKKHHKKKRKGGAKTRAAGTNGKRGGRNA